MGAFVLLLFFLAGAGWAVQQAYADSARAQRFTRLQTIIYALMASAEIDATGALLMPTLLTEPSLTFSGSGLYANIANTDKGENWQSASTLGLDLPFQRAQPTGQWKFDTVRMPNAKIADRFKPGQNFLAATYAVQWSVNDQSTSLVFSVLEDKLEFDHALDAFEKTLWIWLGATGLLLLVTQAMLLRWSLTPLNKVAHEIGRIETGLQTKLEGSYPVELSGLTLNLNRLVEQERARQKRNKEALDDLAHSLKTPLAVLRSSLHDRQHLPTLVAQQVDRMDGIVMHQLGRAAASGATRLFPPLALAAILSRICDTLAKVYFDKKLTIAPECPYGLTWRMDQGDAFEILGNMLDNAAKWARQNVSAQIRVDNQRLCICVCDDGPGFADLQSLPARRIRLDEQVSGHGIGLAVVSDLVATYQGELKLSRAKMGGAQLDIVIPET